MGKLEYLDALKRAMPGLPPETQAKTLAYYEQRFVDAAALGRSEQDVARELGDPRKIAMTLRASAHLDALQQTNNSATPLRLLLTGAGLALFNLFMVVPAAVGAALLAALYACALAFYVGGIAITASGLAGANELLLNLPKVVIMDDSDPGQTRVSIGDSGVEVYQEQPPGERGAAAGEPPSSRVLRGAEAVAGRKIHISTKLDAGSRTTQTLFGLGLVLGGVVLFLLALAGTRYAFIGIRRYLQMNFSLLRGS
jgi:uncharacterized membrane protein